MQFKDGTFKSFNLKLNLDSLYYKEYIDAYFH